jgi:sulfatase maturation enzyme AslB (radical SAM superfamily)
MCWSGASSRIATQYVLWGHEDHRRYLGTDWTKDSVVWDRFLDELLTIPKLKNIHFMGGETLLTPKFEEFVDFMIAHERFDISLSFVTNGTVYKPELIEKLKKFPRVGIEISIETTTEHNDYIRQGSHVEEVIDIIKKYKQLCLGSDVSVTLRPSISALSIGYYHTLLKFALEEKLLIKSLIVTNPPYLNPNILPQTIRDKYLMPYIEILRELNDIDIKNDYNESDINNYSQSVKQQAQQVKLILCNEPIKFNKSELMFWCNRWDQEFGFNMLKLYPEFNEI